MAGFLAVGCGGPNKAAIEVRKQNQKLRQEIQQLTAARNADVATIRSFEERTDGMATTRLSGARLEQLFTTHGIKLGRLTRAVDNDASKPGDDVLKVYLTPIDRAGHSLKAAGSMVVEAFDLDEPQNPRLGRWEFPLEQATQLWYGAAGLSSYVLECPWQSRPARPKITVKVEFLDALTQRKFSEQKTVEIKPANFEAADTRQNADR